MNKNPSTERSKPRRPLRRAALAVGALSVLALTPLTTAAQQLPLVSRELQFHSTPAERVQREQESSTVSTPRVDLRNLPRVPLPAGATILAPQIDSATGLYLDPAGERGPGGKRGVVLPDAPARQPEESLPRLVAGQVYIPPWFDDIRNVRGGRGPFDVPRDRGVRPEDLMLTPPAAPAPGEDLPEEAPAAPQRSALPQGELPAGQQSAGQQPPSQQPAVQPAANFPATPPAATQAPAVPAPPQVAPATLAQPALAQPATGNQAIPGQGQADTASPIPLVSRKLNFQY